MLFNILPKTEYLIRWMCQS